MKYVAGDMTYQLISFLIWYRDNKLSLNDARSNFSSFKAAKKEFLGTDRIREPFPEELPENNM